MASIFKKVIFCALLCGCVFLLIKQLLYKIMVVDIGLLITLVEGFPHLYDLRNKHFKDQLMKKNSWEEIATAMNISADDCQRIWKNLRDRYTKEKRNLPTGTGSEDTQPEWEYFSSMNFLDKHIKPRKTISNIACNKDRPSSSCSTFSSSPCSPWSSLDTILNTPDPDFEEDTQNSEESQIIGRLENNNVKETPKRQTVTPKLRKRKNDEDLSAVVGAVEKITEHITSVSTGHTNDTNDAFGMYVTSKLKESTAEEARTLRAKITFLLESINP